MTEATLVLGMILQRFRLVDHTRYQLKIKESLTIKPEGLMMRVRLRPDVVRGSGQVAGHREAGAEARRRRRPRASHGTKLAVLFGSNMGTAEELARIDRGGCRSGGLCHDPRRASTTWRASCRRKAP